MSGGAIGLLVLRLRANLRLTARVFAASLAANLLGLASSFYTMLVLNRYVTHGVDSTLAALTVGVVLSIAFEHLFRHVRLGIAGRIGRAEHERLTTGAFGILMTARNGAGSAEGDAARREALRAPEQIDSALGSANLATLFDLPFALGFILVVALISWPLAAICLVFTLLAIAAGLLAQADMRAVGRDLAQAGADAQGLVTTAIVGRDAVALFGGAKPLLGDWQRAAKALRVVRERMSMRQGRAQSAAQSLQALQGVAVIATGAVLVVRGELDVGSLIGINLLVGRALAPFTRLAQIGESLAMARQAQARLEQFARTAVEPTGGTSLPRYAGTLELRDLTFTPPGSVTPLLRRLNLSVPAGNILVLKGRNGSGKSTLIRLIAGLADPQEGAVLADGVDIRKFAPSWWRQQIGLLPQEPVFLNRTIRENLLLANPRLSETELHAVLHRAGADRTVADCAQGLDTPLRNFGHELPTGHRRRLALARALAVGGRLILLDEPTDGLDSDGTATVYRTLIELARSGHTVIIASHDPRILQGASLVLDLDQPNGAAVVREPAGLVTP
ncbi:ATP-binding cassette domain-containing protein [Azospirillum brasilense]|uniref:ATP-binding cassette domain-containing protein n=1 Tax=Azospirillum brasilense TaxID=192 RepID=UPI00190A4322|nr:ATP-binding cassette domain-containing protein [Azospirillum brasilense]MBK3736779.1 ATP-binding cassette domain-containing protein [Azospirillum brasilense]